jgi:hypothetical protein
MNLGRLLLSHILGLLYVVWSIPELVSGQQVLRINNFTLNAAPGDWLYLGHLDNITDTVGQITAASSCNAAFTNPAFTSTIQVLDTDATLVQGTAKPYILAKLSSDAIGIFQYSVTCTNVAISYKFNGRIVSRKTDEIKQNTTETLRWNVDASFVTSDNYILKNLGFWPVGLVEGNNMRMSQEAGASPLLNEFISTVRPLVLFNTTGGSPVQMSSFKFKKITMACHKIPADDYPECLFALKEDGKTISTFNYKLRYPNDYRFTFRRDILLNSDTAFVYDDCFVQAPFWAQNIYCYFINPTTNQTKLVSFSATQTTPTEKILPFVIIEVKILEGILFVVMKKNDGKVYVGGINARASTIANIELLGNSAVEVIQATVPGHAGCQALVKDLRQTGGFSLTMHFTCTGANVIARIDTAQLFNAMDANLILNLGQAVPIDLQYTRKVDAAMGGSYTFLCGNKDHALFLTNGNTKVSYQGIRSTGQVLTYTLDGITNVNSVDKIECTTLSTFVKLTTSSGSYVVDISTMGRGLAEWQRVNYILKLENGMDLFDLSDDGNMAVVFQKNKPVYTMADVLEYNRLIGLVKVYDDKITTPGSYSTTIKITNPQGANGLMRRFEVNYFTSASNVALKNSMNEIPRGVRVPFYDYYDISGPYKNIELDTTTSNQDIAQLFFNVDPNRLNSDTKLNSLAARFVLMDNYYIDCEAKTVSKSDGTSKPFSSTVSTGLIAQPRLLGVTIGEEGRQIACLYSASDSKKVQYLYLDSNFDVKISSPMNTPNTTIVDYITRGKRWDIAGFILAYHSVEYDHAALFVYHLYTFNAVTKEYTFNNTESTGRHVFNRSELYHPKFFDKYVVQVWNDPNHAHCPVIVISEGDLVKPFDFRICSLPTSMYGMFNLGTVTMVGTDKIRMDIWEGSQSKEFGTTMAVYTVEAVILEAGSLTIPNNVQWNLVNTKRYKNWSGGLPWTFIENGDEVYVMTRSIIPWSKMTFEGKEQTCVLSMFKKNFDFPTHQVTYNNCSDSGSVRPVVSRYGSNVRVVQYGNATGATPNTTIVDFQLRPHEIMFKSGISVDNLKGINFVFNKGVAGSEVKVPVTAFFGNPPAPSSSSTWWIWLIVILVILSIIGLVGFFMWRRERIRRKTLVDQMMAQDPYAAEVTERFPQDGSKPPSAVHEF